MLLKFNLFAFVCKNTMKYIIWCINTSNCQAPILNNLSRIVDDTGKRKCLFLSCILQHSATVLLNKFVSITYATYLSNCTKATSNCLRFFTPLNRVFAASSFVNHFMLYVACKSENNISIISIILVVGRVWSLRIV